MPVFPKPAPGRLRISLLSLLLLTTCVAMSLGLWLTHQRAERFRLTMSCTLDENRRLRDEYGEFEATDPNLLYAVMMHRESSYSQDYRDWAWRVSVPEGKPFVLRYHDGVVGVSNTPTGNFKHPLEPGTHTIRLKYYYDPDRQPNDAWRGHIHVHSEYPSRRSNMIYSRAVNQPAWPALTGSEKPEVALFQTDEGIGWGRMEPTIDGRHGYAADEPLILQRMRVQTIDRKLVPVKDYSKLPGFDLKADAPGFLIWLEPAP